jgi:hypothetical protein
MISIIKTIFQIDILLKFEKKKIQSKADREKRNQYFKN